MVKQWQSFILDLECTRCGQSFDPAKIQTFCPACQAPLSARYDLASGRTQVDRAEISARPRGMWRWRELLPVTSPEHAITLGEGDAPQLLAAHLGEQLGLSHLWIKDEGMNPTASFKARGLAAAVSKAHELGITGLVIPTAGNAGGAMAAYAARAGMRAVVYMPADTPVANITECRAVGAQVTLVDGLISDAARYARQQSEAEGLFDVSTFKEPYRLEGKKVMGFEIAESFGWKTPDVIIYPTGGGTGLVGIWKAFDELARLGWLEGPVKTRMVAVQAAGCAPVVKAFDEGQEDCAFWENAHTSASGLRVPKSFAGRLILQALRQSGGTAVAVTEEEIQAAQAELAAAEGMFVAPEGAATLAGLKSLLQSGWVNPDEQVLLLNTAMGIKYISA